jgi:hypothetical protein
MPRVHGVRLFSNGISCLTQVSGPEHREICKQLLGCIVDAPGAPAGVIRATRARPSHPDLGYPWCVFSKMGYGSLLTPAGWQVGEQWEGNNLSSGCLYDKAWFTHPPRTRDQHPGSMIG